MFPLKPCIGLVSLLATAACSSQAETDYRGEPLATVRGRVSNPLDLAPEDDLVAAVAWVSYDGEGMKAISSPVAVEGAFPGEFSITLYEPPPQEAFVDTRWQDQALAPVAWGRVVALRAEDVGQATTWDVVRGISLDGAVAYVREVAEGSADQEVVETQAAYYKFSPDPGFKLIAIERSAPQDWVPCGSLGLCVERVGGSELDAREYELCLKYTDTPEVCRIFEDPQDAEEEAETSACWEAVGERDQALQESGASCPRSFEPVENPGGFDTPITLTLGAGLADFHFYDP